MQVRRGFCDMGVSVTGITFYIQNYSVAKGIAVVAVTLLQIFCNKVVASVLLLLLCRRVEVRLGLFYP